MQDIKSLTTEEMWSKKDALTFIKSQVAPTLNQDEWNLFVSIGRNTGTNPLLREIWAVKYGGKCSIFIGRDGYRKSAQRCPAYDSHSVFSVYKNDQLEFLPDGMPRIIPNLKDRGELIGAIAWCKRKGSSMVNCGGLVLLSEYDTKLSNWKTKKDTMIKKVAEAQILRQTFQELFAGTYDESERGAIEAEVVKETGVDEKIVAEISAIKTLDELKKFAEKNRGRGKEFDKLIAEKMKDFSPKKEHPNLDIGFIEKKTSVDKKTGGKIVESAELVEISEAKKALPKKDDLAQDIENALGEGKDLNGKGFPPKTCPNCDAPADGVHDKECPNYKKPASEILAESSEKKSK